jgi:hypothetical protein
MATTQQLFVNQFSFDRIRYASDMPSTGPTVAIIGKRGTGKTYFLRDLMYHFRDVPRVIVFSGSERYNQYFGDFVPQNCIHYEFKAEVLEQLVRDQEEVIKRWHQDKSVDPRVIVVLDDCMWDDTFTRSPIMTYLFFNGRHLRIMLNITMQNPIGLPPRLRGNTDYIFLMNCPNPRDRDKIHANYAAAVIYDRSEFDRIMDQMTQNRNIMVLDNVTMSNNLPDRLFYVLAQERLHFRCGSDKLWNLPLPDRNQYQPGVRRMVGRPIEVTSRANGTPLTNSHATTSAAAIIGLTNHSRGGNPRSRPPAGATSASALSQGR